jgi:hypothetical protein
MGQAAGAFRSLAPEPFVSFTVTIRPAAMGFTMKL